MINEIIKGDCIEEMRKMEANSIDTIITDPPYGLSFMGKKWDYDVPGIDTWKEALRVLKPGGTALIFAGSRTQHRMAVNIEDAGFELKDCIMWLYGSGFPKATDIKKQIDKSGDGTEWNGWKSHGLKPAYEPIIVAMKPNDGTYAQNALKHGVSGLNIDGGRIGYASESDKASSKPQGKTLKHKGWDKDKWLEETKEPHSQGRFPANIILDEEAGKMLDEQSGVKPSRFFYTSKASKSERNAGCEGLEEKEKAGSYKFREDGSLDGKPTAPKANFHPTVKPLALMEYLCTLTKTPTGGTVLDPFMGSGTTGVACRNVGRDFIGIEKDEEYITIAKARLEQPTQEKLV